MKTAVSIPDDVYLRAEELAEQTNRTRSRLYSDALGEYLARHGTDAVTTWKRRRDFEPLAAPRN
jgi:predicted transcriptional regulator